MDRGNHLYAVVPASEAASVSESLAPCRVVCWGELAAVVGTPPGGLSDGDPALEHDRIVGDVLDVCSTVIPFRMGIELSSESEVARVLALNARSLLQCIRRVRLRVEVGVKVVLSANCDSGAPGAGRLAWRWHNVGLPFPLGALYEYAPSPLERQEQICTKRGLRMFEGCYLVERSSADEFLDRFDTLAAASPEVPCLASGPWAPYSFCDLELAWRLDDVMA